MDSLGKYYASLRRNQSLPAEVQTRLWNRWLWGTAVNQPQIDECGDMNMNQGLGIFMCVMLAYAYEEDARDHRSIAELLPHSPLVHLTLGPLHMLSQRNLMDQIECLQLSWGSVVGSHEHLHGRCATVLRLLMARAGDLARHAYGGESTPLDFTQYTTMLPHTRDANGQAFYIVTRKYLRQLCCILVILFRTLHIISEAQVVPPVDDATASHIRGSFQEHHLECSGDFFSTLQQMVQLAPAMRLVYRNDFSGMYNDVSQVVYYHYPQYHRMPQLPLPNIPDSAINCLPLLTQLLPHVPVAYDDDDVIPGLTWYSEIPASPPTYAWLVSCGTVFLVQVDYEQKVGRILASPDAGLVPLIASYIAATGASLSIATENGRTRRKVNLAGHSHAELCGEADSSDDDA